MVFLKQMPFLKGQQIMLNNLTLVFIIVKLLYLYGMQYIASESIEKVSLQSIYEGVALSSCICIVCAIFLTPTSITELFGYSALLTISYVCIRKQLFIDDRAYLRHMIGLHGRAIPPSHARLLASGDSTVQATAEGIIRSHGSEITSMKNLMTSLGDAKYSYAALWGRIWPFRFDRATNSEGR